ncbi:c-type cytochrome [Sorangium atrum]|uniref:C-type cytochrome n=1 Tax=Sorangium atrum TaxID=2995308 RepID=A0ABT5BTM8_9BACT|nr:c-type cytochrome [Sorangium aterium]MDC0677073.1 c-type cytochrome [Sorangium aterium]
MATVSAAAMAAVLLLGERPALADPGEPAEVEARRLVHVLGYVAMDYGGCVANGAVTSVIEYDEQLALLGEAIQVATRIQPSAIESEAGDLAQGIVGVRELVEAKVAPDQVAIASRGARDRVAAAFRLAEAPLSRPDAERGAALYQENCATCHGPTGYADTRRAATLVPHPANFHDAIIAEQLAPVGIESAVRFGVSGTAMIPFTFLSARDRWDLAFHVAGLHHPQPGESPRPLDLPDYSMVELAVRSDADLRAELSARGIPAERHAALLAELRRRVAYGREAASHPLSTARAALDRGRAALREGRLADARAALRTAQLDGIDAAEASVRTVNEALANDLGDGAFALRAELSAGATTEALDAGMATLLRDATYAEVALARSGGAPGRLVAQVSSRLLLREIAAAALFLVALAAVASSRSRRVVHVASGAALLLALAAWVAAALGHMAGFWRTLTAGATIALALAALAGTAALARRREARQMRSHDPSHDGLSRGGRAAVFAAALLAGFGAGFSALDAALGVTLPVAPPAVAGVSITLALLAAGAALVSRASREAARRWGSRPAWLACLLCVPLAGRAVAAFQLCGLLPVHRLPLPRFTALGIYPAVETCLVQAALLGLALAGAARGRRAEGAC